MPTSTLTSKGQTTIPLEVRRKLGLKAGDKMDFVIGEDGIVTLRPATADVTNLKGLLKRPGQKPTDPQMLFLRMVEHHGGCAGWCDSVEAATELMERWRARG